jgi:hypothetical protein
MRINADQSSWLCRARCLSFRYRAAGCDRVNDGAIPRNDTGHRALQFVAIAVTTVLAFGSLRAEEAGFAPLFNGKDLTGWAGDTKGYVAEDGKIVCRPGGNLYTEKTYSDFVLRFEFKLTPGANNGIGIRWPGKGTAAYDGMEIQVLDDSAEKYKTLKPYQFHGSIYGVVPATRGHQKPVGEWNVEEISAIGSRIKVTLNGTVIVDADLAGIKETMDRRPHPGLRSKSGRIGFLGHGSVAEFRNIQIKELNPHPDPLPLGEGISSPPFAGGEDQGEGASVPRGFTAWTRTASGSRW